MLVRFVMAWLAAVAGTALLLVLVMVSQAVARGGRRVVGAARWLARPAAVGPARPQTG